MIRISLRLLDRLRHLQVDVDVHETSLCGVDFIGLYQIIGLSDYIGSLQVAVEVHDERPLLGL